MFHWLVARMESLCLDLLCLSSLEVLHLGRKIESTHNIRVRVGPHVHLGPTAASFPSYHSDRGDARFIVGFLGDFAVSAICLSLRGQDLKNDDSGVAKAAADKSRMRRHQLKSVPRPEFR